MKREKNVCLCPLLKDPAHYVPDTVDLLEDVEAREYWLTCLDCMVRSFANKAPQLNPEKPNASQIMKKCSEQFHEYLKKIKKDPRILNPLSVRTLLEINEKILSDNSFKDFWSFQKKQETLAAFNQFEDRVIFIDSLVDFCEKWIELSKGLVAGNMFDWGARAVTDILEKNNGFGLSHAMDKIQKRPWFHDDLDKWIDKIRSSPYHLAAIFVDNAGVDFVLGVLPFVRQFLLEGTSVIVAANSSPSLNDVTYIDLQHYLQMASEKCSVIQESLINNKLIAIENGEKGPCLDLRNLSSETCSLLEKVDLVILEGMGRAVHTNLNAKFQVDCLKVAVLKNEWLAKRLGGNQFSVIFRYDVAPEINICSSNV